MDKGQDLLNRLNSGKSADIVYGNILEYLEKRRVKLVQILKTRHRQGKPGEIDYVSLVAALVELDDLQTEIETDIKKGRQAAQEIHGPFPTGDTKLPL